MSQFVTNLLAITIFAVLLLSPIAMVLALNARDRRAREKQARENSLQAISDAWPKFCSTGQTGELNKSASKLKAAKASVELEKSEIDKESALIERQNKIFAQGIVVQQFVASNSIDAQKSDSQMKYAALLASELIDDRVWDLLAETGIIQPKLLTGPAKEELSKSLPAPEADSNNDLTDTIPHQE